MTSQYSTPLFLAHRDLGIVGRVICGCKNSFGQELLVVEEKGHVMRLHAYVVAVGDWYPLTHKEFGERDVVDYGKDCSKCGRSPA